jgi:hypothetical protein
MKRFVLWRGVEGLPVEAAEIELGDDGVRASGVQLGVESLPYRLDYRLDAAEGWITRRLELEANGEGWRRSLKLRRDDDGEWHARTGAEGDVEMEPPGGDLSRLGTALDCDLMRSPLTNLMPIRRAGLDRAPGELDLVAAWVSVPDLVVHTYPQRYEHVRRSDHGSVVRFVDRGPAAGFVAELELDSDGLILEYPELATRL